VQPQIKLGRLFGVEGGKLSLRLPGYLAACPYRFSVVSPVFFSAVAGCFSSLPLCVNKNLQGCDGMPTWGILQEKFS
jgi:hypothetical protein